MCVFKGFVFFWLYSVGFLGLAILGILLFMAEPLKTTRAISELAQEISRCYITKIS